MNGFRQRNQKIRFVIEKEHVWIGGGKSDCRETQHETRVGLEKTVAFKGTWSWI